MGTQETIIYRLVKPNLTFGPYLSFLVFEAIFGHKNGRGPTRAHMGLGAQNPTKKLTHLVDPSGPPISQNHDFEIWRPEPPPLNCRFESHLLVLLASATFILTKENFEF